MKNGDEWFEQFLKAYLIVAIGTIFAGLIIPLVVMR